MRKQNPVSLIITDSNNAARYLHSLLNRNFRGNRRHSREKFYYRARYQGKNYIIFSTNGHLQVFQNSSIYKWTGVDPAKIIEDENSVIPVLNAFNKKNYFSLTKILQSENITECIFAITPDTSSFVIAIKEVGNLFSKLEIPFLPKKLLLMSLGQDYILSQLEELETFTFEDNRFAEIEYLRGYLDAIISFSLTQEITYTLKRCLNLRTSFFTELSKILRQDMKDHKNFLIPMSRAQAFIMETVWNNINEVEKKSNLEQGRKFEIFLKITTADGVLRELKLNDIMFDSEETANRFIDSLYMDGHVRIKKTETENLDILPPPLYNLTSLINHVSDKLSFPTNYTHKILLDLYHERFITFPNMEKIQANFVAIKHEDILGKIKELEDFEDIGAKGLHGLLSGEYDALDRINRVPNAIVPIAVQNSQHTYFKEKPNHWKVYALILKRYTLQFLDTMSISEIAIFLDVDKHDDISITTFKIKEEGFSQFIKDSYRNTHTSFSFNPLQSLEINDIFVKETTNVPTYYTDATLLKEIEATGMGDTISYLFMIEKLLGNNYLQMLNQNLKLTKRGEYITRFISETYNFVGSDEFNLFFTETLRNLETANVVESLNDKINEVKKLILSRYNEQFLASRATANEFLVKQGIELEKTEASNRGSRRPSRFQKKMEQILFCDCGSPMKIIETKSKSRFLACENRLECGKTLPLPQEGQVNLVDKKCRICDKKIFQVKSKLRGTYYICVECADRTYAGLSPINNAGYCLKCGEFESCWEGEEEVEKPTSIMVDDNIYHVCPKCQKYDLILHYKESSSREQVLVCENPFCNYTLSVPPGLSGKIEPTSKKCLICPMNAVTFVKDENHRHPICINCYNRYLHNNQEEIGFCLGCIYYKACFKNEMGYTPIKESLTEQVKKKLENISGY